ncbi:DUF2288 domain-containing protein [Synechocystis sp. LKSZ1]|uniref:DUF2288 domain-containing protein n=1 Tax=Synechocystis sp. LKSZ1 TaxID=3144951 RepID=UPI00336BCE03
MTDIQTQLRDELAPMDWETIIPHVKRDAVIIVDPSLDLIEVATAIAEDQVAPVQNWIQAGLLHKPSTADLSDWNHDLKKEFQTLIVQPFVLIQD